MSYIETNAVQHATILRIYSEKDEIIVDPEYQRNGGIWTEEKKQLLIDSILNNYDIPKIYFHQFNRSERVDTGKSFAIIDGKQRLDAIWSFIEGKFALASEFVYQDDPTLKLSGLNYDDISKEYPKIKIKFDSFVLPIVGIQTDDLDLIDDMFSRLNEAVPLNAAEKRNAFGGDMVDAIRTLSKHSFFANKVKFNNNRYQHYETAARLLLVESSLLDNGKLIDTKKEYLDKMARQYKTGELDSITDFLSTITFVLEEMCQIFINSDPLLKAQGNIVAYYLLFKDKGPQNNITRSSILRFIEKVKENRTTAENRYDDADFELLEYDRLSQQGTNDASNIKERLRILQMHLSQF
jgi:hypothetical protein